MSKPVAYGIDFGTSNSSIAVAYDNRVEMGVVNARGDALMPTVVYVDRTGNRLSGYDAVDNYTRFAADERSARFMSSIKTFLSDRSFRHTTAAWGEQYTMPDLVSIVLSQLKRANDRRLGADVRRVVIGHPVLFVGADGPQHDELQQYALNQLEEGAQLAGFEEIAFLDEPTAALMGEDLDQGFLMAVDFGGGTFDVSIIEFAPEWGEVLACQGAAVGGELFDSLLFDAEVAPILGLDQDYLAGSYYVAVPPVLRSMRTLHEIVAMVSNPAVQRAFDAVKAAEDGPNLDMVEEIIYGGHAYNFFRAVEQGKIQLSSTESAEVSFRRPGVSVSASLDRSRFESSIRPNLDIVDAVVERALDDAQIDPNRIDRVVRTGGSSRIPAFVESLRKRFGDTKLAERDAFSTVAFGLGVKGREIWG